jgi:hypothetical protein
MGVETDSTMNDTGTAAGAEELTCPLCDYNLRGLTTPRCPECGYAFEWSELRQRAREHPYLFDRAKLRRVRAFVKTLAWGMWPWKFWTDVRPTHQPRLRFLLRYWVLVVCLSLMALASLYVHFGILLTRDTLAARARETATWKGWMGITGPLPPDAQADIDARYPLPGAWAFHREMLQGLEERIGFVSMLCAFYLLWPWMNFGTLMLFRISMRRARVRSAHVLRCVVYSSDSLALLTPLLLTAAVAHGLLAKRPSPWSTLTYDYVFDAGRALGQRVLAAAGLALLAWCAVRLTVAYKRYLRFPHAGWVVVASQLIVLVFAMLIVLWVDWYAHFVEW